MNKTREEQSVEDNKDFIHYLMIGKEEDFTLLPTLKLKS